MKCLGIFRVLVVFNFTIFYATMDAAEERAAKLARLNTIRRSLPHMTAAGLAALLDEVSGAGSPELRNRSHFSEATRAEVAKHDMCGPLLTTAPVAGKGSSDAELLMINPLSLTQAAYSSGGSFRELVHRALAKHGNSTEKPWRLILYGDEVVPGC